MKARLRTGIGIAVLGALLAAGLTSPAFAAGKDYPSWDDVQNARSNEAATSREVTRVKGLIDSLTSTVADTRQQANLAADAYQTASELAIQASQRAEDLASQKETAEGEAAKSQSQVGALMAQMARGGSSGTTLELLADPDVADDALYKLGAMSKLTTRSTEILNRAKQDANSVTALEEQATVAQDILAEAEKNAASALAQAEEAARAAQAAVDEQTANQDRLIEQLAALENTSKEVASQYAVGVQVRAEEAARLAAAKAAAAAAKAKAEREAREKAEREAAASKPKPGTGGGNTGGGNTGGGNTGGGNTGGGNTGGGNTGTGSGTFWSPSSQGWYRPAPGAITSWYGPRPQICGGTGCSTNGWHAGLDFGGYSGQPIKAIYDGRVSEVYYSSAFGNRVVILHPNGEKSIYGHLQRSAVSVGQQVSAGQVIAYMGQTGVATGPHLDLKTYRNGVEQNPATFLRARGVRV